MKTNYYKTAILILTLTFTVIFYAQSQNSSDKISIKKEGIRTYYYYQNNNVQNIKQLINIVKENEKAYKLVKKAEDLRMASFCFGLAGGACIGYPLGYLLGSSMAGSKVEVEKYFPILIVGTGFLVCSISFEIIANKKVEQGINVFNNSKNNNANLDLGFSTNGFILRLNF